MMTQASNGALVVTVAPERMALAEGAHRSVTRMMFILFGALVAVILATGIPLSLGGRTWLPGILIIAAVFAAFPFIVAWTNSRTLARAKMYVSRDGSTQIVVDTEGMRIADTYLPYERITFVAATVKGETYSMGGIPGEMMAWQVGAVDDRPGLSRIGGALIGSVLRRKLYRDGAKSTLFLTIGVDQKSRLDAPEGFINGLRALPKRGDDPGRIDMPFGAFLEARELEYVIGVIHHLSGGGQFPAGFVFGDLNWSCVQADACEPREVIWKKFSELFAQH